MGAQRAAAPVLSGVVPPLADSYSARQETGLGLADALRAGETTVLACPEEAPAGGTGKTQLAVGFAHAMWRAGAVDLLVWAPATSRDSILASFAQAAGEVDADLPGELADAAARRFVGWLSRTRRRWAVILDDLTDTADLEGLWPRGETGQVVVTTRLPESALRGLDAAITPVVPFSRREALGYLTSRLSGVGDQRIEALDLAEDLGRLPISLAQALAVIVDGTDGCREYRALYAERQRRAAGTVIDGCPPSMLGTWSIAVEWAHGLPPEGLAWPALALAAMVSTSGIPLEVLTSPAACGYITGASEASAEARNLVRAAYANLAQLGLVSLDRASGVRTVWIHPAVQATVRAYLPRDNVEQTAAAAAASVLEAWAAASDAGSASAGAAGSAGAQMEQALRECAAGLRAFAGDLLWKPEAHPVLLRAGVSMADSRLANSAIDYWQSIAATCDRLLGAAHAQAVLARDRLADAYAAAGRMADAISVFEAALADRERALGTDHPDTVTARVNLARSFESAGLHAEAIALYEQTLAECERLFGSAHRDTLAVRASLAATYQATGRRTDSVRLYERTLAETESVLGPAHRDTLTARASLAGAYQSVGQVREAITVSQRVVQDRERTQGADHPDTVAARRQLANAYRLAGKSKDAIVTCERVLADTERLSGPDKPETITARGDLALALRSAGKVKEAISRYERVLADSERVLGPDHRETLSARAGLAAAYQAGRKLPDAIRAYERAVADSERMLGAGDIQTLTTRYSLATAYYDADRKPDTVRVLRRALADCEAFLGADHHMTATVRENLESVTT